jgi:hypothetical protein
MKKTKRPECVLCGKKYDGHGNNPEPIRLVMDSASGIHISFFNKGGRCCDKCNGRVVIARIRLMKDK